MKDVAKRAEVSVGTVSKVFNHQPVGESYRQRVLKAAEELNFRFNRPARKLPAGNSSTIALILPDLLDPFYADFALRVFDVLAQNECSTLLFLSHGQVEEEKNCLKQACDHGADGIIALCQSEPEAEQDVALVAIDASYLTRCPSVTSDNFGGGQLAAQTLRQLGCTTVLGLEEETSSFGERQKRLLGFELACRSQGVEYQLWRSGEQDGASILEFLKAHTQASRLDFDGIFCTSDEMVYQVREYLSECSIAVPGDVQIIGYGGMSKSGMRAFSCSTIRIPVQEMAETAVNLVLGKVQSHPGTISLSVDFLPGKTTEGAQP